MSEAEREFALPPVTKSLAHQVSPMLDLLMVDVFMANVKAIHFVLVLHAEASENVPAVVDNLSILLGVYSSTLQVFVVHSLLVFSGSVAIQQRGRPKLAMVAPINMVVELMSLLEVQVTLRTVVFACIAGNDAVLELQT